MGIGAITPEEQQRLTQYGQNTLPQSQAQNTGNPLDLPQFGGPYIAPLTQGGLDALQGFNRLTPQGPLVQGGDITRALGAGLGGIPAWDPKVGQSLAQWTSQFAMPGQSASIAQGLAGAPQSFDTTELFKTGEALMRSDLDRAMAQTREEYSGLGLGPGSSDRAMGLTRTAGDVINQFRLGQQQTGMQAFENARNRQLTALPTAAALEQQPFQNMMAIAEPAAQRSMQTLPYLFQAQQQPLSQYAQQFSLNEAARQVADQESIRRLQEFARTQGGGLQQLLAILSGTPLNNTAVGPSLLSQIGQLISGAGTTAAAAGGK